MNKKRVKNQLDVDKFEEYNPYKCKYLRIYNHFTDYTQIGCVKGLSPNRKRCLNLVSRCYSYRRIKK